MTVSPEAHEILSVSALNQLARRALESRFPAVWVRGEVFGAQRPSSGHVYFTLKEGNRAAIQCAVYRTQASRLRFELRDGLEVEAFGKVTLYEARGNYQLAVEVMRPAGLGALLLALEDLKRRLQVEGLFDPARKRPLPRYPDAIGIVTSPTGAAVRDVVKVLRTRWPSVRIVLAPVRVQGDGAAGEIARAVQRFNRYAQVDVLIVGRGGGALEDLWAFNDEGVVRAIAASRIPVISAIGHEVDTTLADLAADVRAATPSNAAELAVPDRRAVRRLADGLRERADRTLAESLATMRRRLEDVLARYGFRRQRDVVDRWRQRLDDLMGRTLDAVRGALDRLRERTRSAAERYGLREFPRAVAGRRTEIEEASRRLGRALAEAVRGRRTRVASADDRLRALSPRLVLERGYCLVRGPDGRLLRAAAELSVGERIALEFARGQADARVEAVRSGDSNGR